MVVDSKHAFVGGVGIAQEWMGDASSSMEWRDNHFAVTGPVVSAIEGGFTRNWLDATGELLVVPRIDQSREGDGCDKAADTRLLVITAAPRGSQSSVAIAYWASIKAAQHSVDIATPYFVPDKILLGTLLDAAQRGIRVRLIVPGENTDSNMVRWACRSYYAQLLNAGVDVYEFNPSMMHTKLIVIDAKWSLFGSSNFDHRSVALNDEILLIADDEQLAGELIGQYDKDVEGATQVMSARHKPLRRIQRFISSVALVMRSNL